MALPLAANTTCDIYHAGHSPVGDDPDVPGVACHLKPDYRGGKEAAEVASFHSWTHVMLIDSSVDIRDWYQKSAIEAQQDVVWIPDRNGTPLKVVFAELVGRGTASEHLRVFLDRGIPPWPVTPV